MMIAPMLLPLTYYNNTGLINLCATDDKTPCASTYFNQASLCGMNTPLVPHQTLLFQFLDPTNVVEIYEDNCNISLAGDCDKCYPDCPEPQTIAIFVKFFSNCWQLL